MARQRRAGGGVDELPSGRYRVRIVTPDGRRVSLGTHPTKRAAEAAYARSPTRERDCAIAEALDGLIRTAAR